MIDIKKIRLFHLYKQNLLHPLADNKWEKLIRDHICLHATDPLTPYFSCFARVENFQAEQLFSQLRESEQIFRTRGFRGTLFFVDRHWLRLILAVAPVIFRQSIRFIEKMAAQKNLDLSQTSREVLSLFKNREALSTRELKSRYGKEIDSENWQIVLRYLEWRGKLLRLGMRYITEPFLRYGVLEHWLPDLAAQEIDPEESLKKILAAYIEKFGPVTLTDICWWFPLTKTHAKKLVGELVETSKVVTVDWHEKQYFMTNSDFQKYLKFDVGDISLPVINFLPYEDHFPKAYKEREWYISEALQGKLFNVGKIDYGQLRPSIWVNGIVVGRWEMEWLNERKDSASVRIVHLLPDLAQKKEIQSLVEKKKSELEQFINEQLLPLKNK